jgi:hypothetical protein
VEPPVTYTEERTECAARNPQRNVYFGDLHVHTSLSFDAYVHEVRVTPEQAYQFAQGGEVAVPPMGSDGEGTQRVRLRRPLDFAAVTDHAEFIGPALDCINEGTAAYAHEVCAQFRSGDPAGIIRFGLQLTLVGPERFPALCNADGVDCDASTQSAWQLLIGAAEDAYDRSEACEFTTFIGYEWTGNTGGSNLHRNVIFRNADVPVFPISYFEQGTAAGLWRALDEVCSSRDRCEVLAIPHNSNLSNGRMFIPEAIEDEDEQELAALRRRMEPLVEIFQHKGSSECMNGLSGIFGTPDELCDVENLRLAAPDCGDSSGGGLGIRNSGCVSRYDFARNVLLEGLAEERRLGVNPYELGFIGSTDTHNGTPGAVAEADWAGHQGREEATIEDRFSPPGAALTGVVNNPGGLAGVWAVENSRDAIFDALQRRETFGTSGPRIAPRFFGGVGLSDALCADPEMIARAYQGGVSMGSTLPASPEAPTFLGHATMDPDGNPLAKLQIVKGWLDVEGNRRYEVHDVVEREGALDEDSCAPSGGAATLCAAWRDEDHDPSQPAWYYLRVVEVPSCRWSTWDCLRAEGEDRPEACDDPALEKTIREMAWTSPIWTP